MSYQLILGMMSMLNGYKDKNKFYYAINTELY